MAQTLKNIVDDVMNLLYRFRVTDEARVDPTWLAYKINQVRADLISKKFAQTGELESTWLSDMNTLTCYKVSWTDDANVIVGKYVGKTSIPQVLSLVSDDGNLDLGIHSITSLSNQFGASQFYPSTLFQFFYEPKEHTYANFKWYFRLNTDLYLSDPNTTSVRMIGVLLDPTEAKLISSAPIASGSIANGTNYTVRFGQIVYGTTVYQAGDTFNGTATTTYSGSGKVYLTSQVSAYRDVDPYPASGDMIRQIVFEILTKEFAIEKQQLADVRNDSIDDANKTVAI